MMVKRDIEAELGYKLNIAAGVFLALFHMSLTYMNVGKLPLIMFPIAFLFYLNLISDLLGSELLLEGFFEGIRV